MSVNKVILHGRLTADPEVRYTQGEKPMCIARYRLAVNRNRKNDKGEYPADFIPCVAFGRNGEFAEKHLKKGMQINVVGAWQTGSYKNKDGQTVYTNDCIVEEQDFCGNKQETQPQRTQAPQPTGYDGFMSIPDGIDEQLPFA